MIVKTLDSLTLEELTDTYLCNKYDKDPIRCLDCESHDTCPAGKRAIEILNEMTESKHLSKWEKASLVNSLKARNRAIEILKQDDPIKYLIEVKGLKHSAARERIRKYKKAYPDLFIENDVPIPPKSFKIKDAERKAVYMEAMASGKPIDFYMNKYGLKRDAAWHRLKDAKVKFGEVVNDNETEKKETQMVVEQHFYADDDTLDEISMEDFLNMHRTDDVDDTTDDIGNIVDDTAKEVTDDEPVNSGERKETVKAEGCEPDSVKDKYSALILERNALLDKLRWYDDAIQAFETVMDILYNKNQEETK